MRRFRLRSEGPAPQAEKDVVKACLDVLRYHQWWPIRQHVGRFRTRDDRWVTIGEAGDPDYVVVKPPSFFLELKRPGGELSEAQISRIDNLRQFYGLDTVVVDNIDQLLAWLAKLERSP